jgi:hypothetical protein
MTTIPPFTWKGYTVHLHHLEGDAPIWVAELEDSDLTYVVPGRVDDDPERIRHLVRDWIDDGFRGAIGLSA